MTEKKGAPAAARKPRADGERNRQRLIEVAKEVFAEKGAKASLDEIARAAGVGIGTLYRHFPSRDALVTAVYHNETEQLAASAKKLAKSHEPVKALRTWLLQFVSFMATKRGMSEMLDAIVVGTPSLYTDTGTMVQEAIQMLVDRAVASGDIRLSMDPLDLLRALAGVAYVAGGPNWEKAARQLVDIMIAGMRVAR